MTIPPMLCATKTTGFCDIIRVGIGCSSRVPFVLLNNGLQLRSTPKYEALAITPDQSHARWQSTGSLPSNPSHTQNCESEHYESLCDEEATPWARSMMGRARGTRSVCFHPPGHE